jgi:hypothetical protein
VLSSGTRGAFYSLRRQTRLSPTSLEVGFANSHAIVVTLLESTESDLSLSPFPW